MSHAETAVIGCLLADGESFEDIGDILKEEDFGSGSLKRIFCAIRDMRENGKTVDLITVSSFLKEKNHENENESFFEIARIAAGTFCPSNVRLYAEIVKKDSNKRKTLFLLNRAVQKINEHDEEYMDFLRNGIAEVENSNPVAIRRYGDLLNETLQSIGDGSSMPGISTGFMELDRHVNGLQKGNMVILAARPSVGKTIFMLNIAENISCYKTCLPVVVFSLEMSAQDLCKRSICRAARISGDLIFGTGAKNEHWEKLSKGVEKLSGSKLFLNDRSNMDINQMRSFCRKIKNEHGLSAIFVDYIGLMAGEGENETLRLANISRGIKGIAKDFNVPVVVLCQLNREIEKRQAKDRRPRLSDLRQSGNIEQDADIVMFLDREEKHSAEATVIIEKNRNGRTGEFKLFARNEFFEFSNYYYGKDARNEKTNHSLCD